VVDSSIGAAARPTLVVVGAASRDVDVADARGWRLGGAVTYSSLTAARLGLRVRALVGVDRQATQAHELDILRASGVEVNLVPLEHGPVFENRQTESGRQQHALSASDQLPVDALPADWRAPTAALLGPIAAELGEEWAAAFDHSAFVALAAQGLVRRIEAGTQVQPLPFTRGALVERADAILASAEDLVAGSHPLRELLRTGQTMLITHGDKGALALQRRSTGISGRYVPPLPRRQAIDTTGAGDTFLAAWLAARLLTGNDDWRALTVAAAMASLSVQRRTFDESPSLADLCEALVRQRDRHPESADDAGTQADADGAGGGQGPPRL